jgi:nicotinamidase/pyrazinamidase
MSASSIHIRPAEDAILHVDVQTAFMEEHEWGGVRLDAGGLPVPGGHEILPIVLADTSWFADGRRYASVDRHPRGHISFASSYDGYPPLVTDLSLDDVRAWGASRIVSPLFDRGGLERYLAGVPGAKQTLWTDHGLDGLPESQLHPALASMAFREVVIKGTDPTCDSYSAVRDNLGRPTGLADRMRADGVRRVFVDGLAFTHCVGWTALDLRAEGFEVFLVKDATRPVPIPGLEDEMTRQLLAAGVTIIGSTDLG